jgi:hypothetical protein
MRFLLESGMSHYRLFIPRNQKQVDQIIEFLKNESEQIEQNV